MQVSCAENMLDPEGRSVTQFRGASLTLPAYFVLTKLPALNFQEELAARAELDKLAKVCGARCNCQTVVEACMMSASFRTMRTLCA